MMSDDAKELALRLNAETELRDVMKQRQDQIEQLRDQITVIENENEDLREVPRTH